ncbi:MAG: RecX family transcriptional regulator [Bacteroidaceae bacterium]|nr:RecX family transcriptional regulator [Bacteroidaceae bacterium]
MAAFCSISEHCESEVRERLQKAGVSPDEADRIVDYLYDEQYLDAARYCRAFSRDRLRFAHWGRIKIQQALRLKGLPDADIRQALEELPAEEYQSILRSILQQKRRSLPDDEDAYTLKGKLIRFATGRGFTMDEILEHLDHL